MGKTFPILLTSVPNKDRTRVLQLLLADAGRRGLPLELATDMARGRMPARA